jgi:hypothetical protein
LNIQLNATAEPVSPGASAAIPQREPTGHTLTIDFLQEANTEELEFMNFKKLLF